MAPTVPFSPDELLEVARRVGPAGPFGRLWQGQAHRLDPEATFAAMTGTGYRVPLGICVAVMPMRHPYQAALEARTLAVLSGASPIYGIGPGSAVRQRQLLGAPYAHPLRAVREYMQAMRRALLPAGLGGLSDGMDAEYFPMPEALPPVPAPQVHLGLGVLRPAMARLAGELADAALTWLAPPDYLSATVAPALAEAAERAGRPRPHLASMVPVAVRRAGRSPVDLVNDVAGGHFALPHYADMLARAGVDVSAGDPRTNAAAFLAGDGFAYGTAAEVVEQLGRYKEAGVDEVIVTVNGTAHRYGAAAALLDLDAIAAALPQRQQLTAPSR